MAKSLTTDDGFLIKGFQINAPFDIPVQRFGGMSLKKDDFWGLSIGKSEFLNRTFVAILPEWNTLEVLTQGTIPKGTNIKFGILGPQGLKYPGGLLQFVVPSKEVLFQKSEIISR